MKHFLFSNFILFSFLVNGQNDELKKQLTEVGKEVLKDQVSNALKKELGNQLGQIGGDAIVGTVFNIIDKQAHKAKVREQISDANNQLLHLKIDLHDGKINRLRISPDSKYIITAGEDNRVLITDLANGRLVKEIETEKEVLDIKFHPKSNFMALGMSGLVDIWNLDQLTLAKSFELNGNALGIAPLAQSASLIYFHPTNADQLIYFNPKKTFTCYDFITEEVIYESNVKAPSTAVNALKGTYNIYQSIGRTQGFLKSWFPTADGKHIIIQTRKSTYLWDPYKEEEVLEYQRNKGSKDYVGIPYLILENELFTSSEDDIILYDVANGNVRKKAKIPLATTLGQAHERKIIFSPDKAYFMVGGREIIEEQEIVSLDFYNSQTLSKVISFPGNLQGFREHYHYDWSRNGKYIVKYCASCKEESVIVYDVESESAQPEVQPTTHASQNESNMYDQLRELKKLLDEGILTQEEFDQQKEKVLEDRK